MTYNDIIDYLFARLPMFSRVGAAAYKKDLTNTIDLCNFLGNPQSTFKSIHIAGTNGKGSVSHMLTAILETAGYKTGLYTSPHLKDFRERIKVNGKMIPKEFVVQFTEKIKPEIERIEPSFFEITVAMAFDYFAEQQVEVAIIETGLGGRLDSTNIIIPELSVITNIGWDHVNLLGDTLEKIALEKAGIIKQQIPIVIGEILPETWPVFRAKAAEKNAPLFIATEEFEIKSTQSEQQYLAVTIAGKKVQTYLLDLLGLYQTKNLLTVLTAIERLKETGWNITDENTYTALRQVKKLTGFFGRWDVLRKSPMIILDVAHNVNGFEYLIDQINHTRYENLHLVTGFVKDKDAGAVLKLLPKNAKYYFTKAEIARALPAEDLKKMAGNYGLIGECYTTVNTALYAASLNTGPNDLVIVCGSIFLVGEVSLKSLDTIWKRDDYDYYTLHFPEIFDFYLE